MTYFDCERADCEQSGGAVAQRIAPREKDLGGFSVRRVLPSRERRMVGPFVFFDHMGPATFPPGQGLAVRPHPHIGLATITYLFEGEIMHRDSLGYEQAIRPGAVNLMTAGRGIVHSERAGSDLDRESRLHGIQSWIALPRDQQEIEPAFTHYPAGALAETVVDGASVRAILGSAFGISSPVTTFSPTLYLECRLSAGARLNLPPEYAELAVYVVEGEALVGGEEVERGVMAVVREGQRVMLEATDDTHLMVIGGEPLGERIVWWNFVSDSMDRIELARRDWREGRFAMVPGDDEFIPLPD